MKQENLEKYFQYGEYDFLLSQISLFPETLWSSDLYYIFSFAAFQKWKFDLSLELASKWSELYPWDARFRENILLIRFSQWNFSQILSDIKSVRKNFWYDSEYLCNLECQTYIDFYGDYDTAYKLYIHSLEIYPNSTILKYYFWCLNYRKWNFQKAYDIVYFWCNQDFVYIYYIFIKCIKKNKKVSLNVWYFLRIFWSNSDEFKNDFTCLWNIYYELWEYKKALVYYLESLKNIDNDYCTYNGIANVFFKLWRYHESLMYFKKSLTIRRQDPYAIIWIANVYYTQKKYMEALTYYRIYYTPSSQNAYQLYRIGMCMYYLEHFFDAKDFFERSLQCDDSNYMALRYLKKAKNKLWI